MNTIRNIIETKISNTKALLNKIDYKRNDFILFLS